MRLFIPIACSMVLATTPALANEPTGEWRVANGSANIRIENCGGALWGVVSWEKVPGRDNANPDPALRGRPTLGAPILLGMKPKTQQGWGGTEQRWEGQIYNAENGKMYDSNIKLLNQNTLRVEGCVLGGIFCGGQEWTRVAQAPAPPQTKGINPKSAGKGAGASDVCSRVSNLAGRPH